MPNFTDEQILEIVKRYNQEDECVFEGEEKWCCEYINYISYETDVEGKYVSYLTVYEVKGEKNKYVAVEAVKPIRVTGETLILSQLMHILLFQKK